jgi:hypothetical protein
MTAKERVQALLGKMPDDVTMEKILRELVFEYMLHRGLHDARCGRVISNEEMKNRLDNI